MHFFRPVVGLQTIIVDGPSRHVQMYVWVFSFSICPSNFSPYLYNDGGHINKEEEEDEEK